MSNITTASHQWATRPADQRFLTLESLHASTLKRRNESWTSVLSPSTMRIIEDDSEIVLRVNDNTQGRERDLTCTNHGFNQLASYSQFSAGELRKLPAPLTGLILQYQMDHNPKFNGGGLMLAQSNGQESMRCITSQSYGRIWDHQVAEAVMAVNADGRWQIPAASYTSSNPNRATTLYASDRDVFIFLVDPKNPVEVNGEQLFRGFFTWNSEVGNATFGLTTFLYRYVCDNRIIWGATDVKELNIRHTGGAQDRFRYEGAQYLRRYADASTAKLTETITAAKAKDLNTEINKGKGETIADWIRKRGFTKAQSLGAVNAAKVEEREPETLWGVVNGLTAYARTIDNTDERVEVESKAGNLLSLVS